MHYFTHLSNFWLVGFLALTHMVVAEGPAITVCGADVVTVGDAWAKITLLEEEVTRLLNHGKTDSIPEKMAAIFVHSRFMEENAIMVWGPRKKTLRRSLRATETLKDEIILRANMGEGESLQKTWGEMIHVLKLMAAQFPEEALISSERFAHLLPPVEPVLYVQLEPLSQVVPGKPLNIKFQMVHLNDVKPVAQEELLSTHGAWLHAIICDQSLTDYHHEHPVPTGNPGEWELTFIPRFNEPYRLWINAVPKQTGREEFAMNQISLPAATRLPEKLPQLTSDAAGMKAKIVWLGEDTPQAKKLNRASLTISQPNGQAVTDLEMHMEAQAHLVGINEDFRTLLHIHPEKPTEGSPPEIRFTINPPRPGFYKLFVQVKRQGEIHTFPFGIQVK